MKIALCSGCDANFFPLMEGLLASLDQNVQRDDADLCIFDFGLSEDQKTRLSANGAKLIVPGWDLTFPHFKQPPPDYKKKLTATPFGNDHLKDYNLVVWLDADAWCQNGRGVDLLIQGAASGRLAIVPEVDRCYSPPLSGTKVRLFSSNLPWLGGRKRAVRTWLSQRIIQLYGDRATANRLFFAPTYNAGIWALRTDAPHWAHWQNAMRKARFKDTADLCDQVPLNYAIQTQDLPVEALPAWCNWNCNLGTPQFDPACGQLVEPFLPQTPLSIVHLINKTKDKTFDMPVAGDDTVSSKLDWHSVQALKRARTAASS